MILVTNDDGYSRGLEMLLKAAKQVDEAYAVIPAKHRSAVSCALTSHKPLRFAKHSQDIYTLNGTPADCVLFSIYSGDVTKPDLILSGLNFGDNSGLSAIICSGTLGACLTASVEGVPAIGFSLCIPNRDAWRNKTEWGDETKIVEAIVKLIKELKSKIKDGMFFSVNLPMSDLDKAKIIYPEKLQRSRFKTIITKRNDPYDLPYYWLSGDYSNAEKGTDLYEVLVNKNITVTPISINMLYDK
ncbi:MAG: 5'/3'-nucleotidase SurE [Candidatus Micrarchaeota archaeon]